MNSTLTFIYSHHAAIMVLFGWAIRECHNAWPVLCRIYPYLSENGGVVGVIATFFRGKKAIDISESKPILPPTDVNQPPKVNP